MVGFAEWGGVLLSAVGLDQVILGSNITEQLGIFWPQALIFGGSWSFFGTNASTEERAFILSSVVKVIAEGPEKKW